MMIEFEVDTSGFEEWIHTVHNRFPQMVQTLIDVFHLIQANTNQLVPLDTGRLESSFYYQLYENIPSSLEMHYIYDAVDPKYFFHYAYYQHELEHRGRGSYSRYTRAKQSYFTSGSNHHRHGTRGTDHYLFKGIQASESMMWTIIEQDYLSLFYGGL